MVKNPIFYQDTHIHMDNHRSLQGAQLVKYVDYLMKTISAVYWHADFGSPLSLATDVALQGIGIDERMPVWTVNRPHGTSDYLLVHFHDPVQVLLHGETRELPAHTCVIWPPDTCHRFGSDKPWSHSWMLCGGTRVKAAIEASGLNLQEPIPQSGAETAMRYLRLLHGEVIRNSSPDPLILEGFLALWLREVFRDALGQTAHPRRIPARLLAVRQAIDSDPTKPLSLALLARQAAMSPSHFSAEFRRCFAVSPIAYVLRLRLKRARYLLFDHHLSIGNVARRCGFTDPHYFARQFAAHFGKPPRAFRT